MLLKAFLTQFGVLGDEFLLHFSRPFLLEEGRLQLEDDEDDSPESRQVYYLQCDEDPLLLGRGGKADVRILDRNASTRHAHLLPPVGYDEGWRLVDLGSTNGTFLNGQKLEAMTAYPIRDESVIGIGPILSFVFLEPQTFLFHLRRLAGKQGLESRPEPYLGEGTEVGQAAVALPDVSGSDQEAAASDADELSLVCEPFDPVRLAPGQKVIIGRSGLHADMVLPHPQVSRRHAEIEVRDDSRVFIRDLKSANGTILGQAKLGTDPVELPPGLAVRIADFRLLLKAPIAEMGGATTIMPPAEQKRKLIKGSLKKLPLGELLASIEDKQKTGRLRIDGSSLGGDITFSAGRPNRATTDDGRQGDEAIQFLLKQTDGTFTIDPTPGDFGERQVKRSFGELVLEDFLDG